MMTNDKGEDKAKKKKGTWDPDNMHTAVKMVLSKQMSSRQASDKYEVPRTTLDDRIRAIKNKKEVSIKPVMGRFHKTFSPEHEQVLAEHVKDLANRP